MVATAFSQADVKQNNQQHQNMPSVSLSDSLDV